MAAARHACIRGAAARLGRQARALAVVALVALAASLLAAPRADAARDIPIGLYNLNGARDQDGPNRIWAMRFVIDHDTRLQRLFTGFNMEGVYTDSANRPAPVEIRSRVLDKGYGAPAAPSDLPADWTPGKGRIAYAHGDGGIVRARLVPMKSDGTPDLANVLAEETFAPVERWKQTKAEFRIGDRPGLVYANFGGVRLRGRTPYWVVYQNVDRDPRMNYVSFNSPVVKASEAGPNGRNTLDPGARGAIAGLDPREVVAWTWDSGAGWHWGREVGGGGPFIPGDYIGSQSSDQGTRLPWYAWQEAGSARLRSNQPYMAYPDASMPGRYTLRVKSSPRRAVLTEAGGYAPVGREAGVITVRNLRTGQTGRTAWLGTGIARGRLDSPVTIEAGDSYEISNTGAVWKAQGDLFLQAMGLIGPGDSPYETVGYEYDRAELFAGPSPFYEQAGAGSAPPAGTRAPAAATRAPSTPTASTTTALAAAGAAPAAAKSASRSAKAAMRRACAKPKRLSRKPAKRRRQLAKARKRCKAAKRVYKRSRKAAARAAATSDGSA
jgi:hypothetical protein